MSKPVTYLQCRMTRELDGGTQTRVSWLPVEFAMVGSVVKIRDRGEWSDGWIVVAAGPPEVAERKASDLNRAHLHQRAASDI